MGLSENTVRIWYLWIHWSIIIFPIFHHFPVPWLGINGIHHGQTLASCQTRPRPSLWCFRCGEVSQNPQQAANYSCEVSGGRNTQLGGKMRCCQWKGLRPSNPIVYSALRCCFEIHRAEFALGSSQTAPKLEQLHPMTYQWSHFDLLPTLQGSR